jgi:uncharacterized membrane protein
LEASSPTTNRLEAFSDGVFAVAATLLVLNLKPGADGTFAHRLASQWPRSATYVVSFLTLGIIWLNHHSQLGRIKRPDRTLMVLNLFLLLFVTLTPFPTGLLAEYLHSGSNGHVAAAFYAATMLAMSIAFFSLYVWAARQRLFAGSIDDRQAAYLLRRNGAGLLVYATAIGLAFISATASLAFCGAVAIFYLFPGRHAKTA